MAKTLLTSNVVYKPMSLESMLKPFELMTEEYRRLEAGIAELEGQAESVKQQALLEPEGSKARKQYEDYSKKLEQAASDLASKGLKGVNRKSVLDLNTQYKSSIKPIEDLIKYRSDIAEEQRKLDPRFVVDRDFSQVTLDELMANPNLGYSKYDLEDYSKRGAIAGASIMNRLQENATLNRESKGQWWDITKGISEKDFNNWLSGNTDNMSEGTINTLNTLKSQVDAIVGDAPESVKNQLLARTLEGAYSSFKETHTTRENKNFITDYQQAQLNLEAQKAIGKARKNGTKNIDKTYLSFALDKEAMKNLGSYIDDKGNFKNEKDLFDDNGKLRPYNTVKALSNPQIYSKYNEGLTLEKSVENPIYTSLINLGFTAEELNNMSKEDIKDLFKSFKNETRNDAAARQVYRFSLDSTATDHIKGKLISSMPEAELEEVKSLKGGSPEYGSKKSIDKIFTEGEAANILFDPVDNEFRIQAGGKYYKLPKGIVSNDIYSTLNNYLQPNAQFGNMSKLQALQSAIEILENKKSLSQQEYLRLSQYYNDLDEINSLFGTVGNDFVKYIGKKNINE